MQIKVVLLLKPSVKNLPLPNGLNRTVRRRFLFLKINTQYLQEKMILLLFLMVNLIIYHFQSCVCLFVGLSFTITDSKLLDSSVDTYASQFLLDQEMVTLPTMPSPKPTETIIPIEYPSSGVSNGPTTSRLDSNPPLLKHGNPRNLLIDDEDTDKYRHRHIPVTKSGSNLLGYVCFPKVFVRPYFGELECDNLSASTRGRLGF